MAKENSSQVDPAGSPGVVAGAAQSDADAAVDPLASLKHMSTTAGVGTGDYVAINPVAVVSVMLGLASLVAFLGDILLIVPAIGVLCGIVAIWQVRHSNGTQSGLLLAVLGIATSLAIGGTFGALKAVKAAEAGHAEKEISSIITALGEDLSNDRYSAAYARFSDRFHTRVPETVFVEKMKALTAHHGAGPLRDIRWNNQALPVDDAPPSTPTYWTMAFFRFGNEKPQDVDLRLSLQFMRVNGKWVIEAFPTVFPAEQ